MQETWVQSLGWEDALEKRVATHSSILSWRIPWTDTTEWPTSSLSQKTSITKCMRICRYTTGSVQLPVVSDSLQPHEPQHARPPCPSPTARVYPNPCPLSRWCYLTISSSVTPSSPAFNVSQHQDLFKWVSSSHQVIKVLEFQPQHQSFQWIFRTDLL